MSSARRIDADSLAKIAARNNTTVEEMAARCAAGKCWRCGGEPYRLTPLGLPVCASCALELIQRAVSDIT